MSIAPLADALGRARPRTLAPIRSTLEALLACQRYAVRPGSTGRVLRHRRRRHTDLLQVAISWPGGGGETVWVKRYLHDRNDAEKEWRFLRAAAGRFAGARSLALPEPIAWLVEQAAIVTLDAAGEQLSRKVHRTFGLFAGASRREQAATGCHRAGAWLARLHLPPVPGGDDPQRVVASVEELLRPYTSMDARSILDTMIRLARRAAGEEGYRVLVHGDFGAHNVLIDGDQAIALDPSFPADLDALGNVASPCEDLGRFLSILIGTRLERSGSTVERELTRSFLDGYDSGSSRPPTRRSSPSLVLFTAKHVLSNLIAWRSRLTPVAVALARFTVWLRTVDASTA